MCVCAFVCVMYIVCMPVARGSINRTAGLLKVLIVTYEAPCVYPNTKSMSPAVTFGLKHHTGGIDQSPISPGCACAEGVHVCMCFCHAYVCACVQVCVICV